MRLAYKTASFGLFTALLAAACVSGAESDGVRVSDIVLDDILSILQAQADQARVDIHVIREFANSAAYKGLFAQEAYNAAMEQLEEALRSEPKETLAEQLSEYERIRMEAANQKDLLAKGPKASMQNMMAHAIESGYLSQISQAMYDIYDYADGTISTANKEALADLTFEMRKIAKESDVALWGPWRQCFLKFDRIMLQARTAATSLASDMELLHVVKDLADRYNAESIDGPMTIETIDAYALPYKQTVEDMNDRLASLDDELYSKLDEYKPELLWEYQKLAEEARVLHEELQQISLHNPAVYPTRYQIIKMLRQEVSRGGMHHHYCTDLENPSNPVQHKINEIFRPINVSWELVARYNRAVFDALASDLQESVIVPSQVTHGVFGYERRLGLVILTKSQEELEYVRDSISAQNLRDIQSYLQELERARESVEVLYNGTSEDMEDFTGIIFKEVYRNYFTAKALVANVI